jgi:spermidine/putrescine transport system substrate-binding protein
LAEDAFIKLRSGFVPEIAHRGITDVPPRSITGLFQPIIVSRLSDWGDAIPDLRNLPRNLADRKPWLVPFTWRQTSIAYRNKLYDLQGEESSSER